MRRVLALTALVGLAPLACKEPTVVPADGGAARPAATSPAPPPPATDATADGAARAKTAAGGAPPLAPDFVYRYEQGGVVYRIKLDGPIRLGDTRFGFVDDPRCTREPG